MKENVKMRRQKFTTILDFIAYGFAQQWLKVGGDGRNVQLQVTPTIPALLKKTLF